MMCFGRCFGTSKDVQKRHKNARIANSHVPNFEHNVGKQTVDDANQDLISNPINRTLVESSHNEEESSSLEARKKVTFDSNTKEHTHLASEEAPEISEQNEIEVSEDSTKPGKPSSSSENGSTGLDSYQKTPPKKLTPIIFTLIPSAALRMLKDSAQDWREIFGQSRVQG